MGDPEADAARHLAPHQPDQPGPRQSPDELRRPVAGEVVRVDVAGDPESQSDGGVEMGTAATAGAMSGSIAEMHRDAVASTASMMMRRGGFRT
jgi:hypothetical protein